MPLLARHSDPHTAQIFGGGPPGHSPMKPRQRFQIRPGRSRHPTTKRKRDSLPSPLPRVLLPSLKHPIILRSNDVAQPDVDNLCSRVPPTKLLAHLLAQELREGIRRLGPFHVLRDRQLGRRVRVQRDAKDGLGGRDRDVLDPQDARRFEDVVCLEDVCVEDDMVGLASARFRAAPHCRWSRIGWQGPGTRRESRGRRALSETHRSRRSRDSCQVDHSVDAPVSRVHLAQKSNDLAIVFQVTLQKLCLDSRFGRRGRNSVDWR